MKTVNSQADIWVLQPLQHTVDFAEVSPCLLGKGGGETFLKSIRYEGHRCAACVLRQEELTQPTNFLPSQSRTVQIKELRGSSYLMGLGHNNNSIIRGESLIDPTVSWIILLPTLKELWWDPDATGPWTPFLLL